MADEELQVKAEQALTARHSAHRPTDGDGNLYGLGYCHGWVDGHVYAAQESEALIGQLRAVVEAVRRWRKADTEPELSRAWDSLEEEMDELDQGPNRREGSEQQADQP